MLPVSTSQHPLVVAILSVGDLANRAGPSGLNHCHGSCLAQSRWSTTCLFLVYVSPYFTSTSHRLKVPSLDSLQTISTPANSPHQPSTPRPFSDDLAWRPCPTTSLHCFHLLRSTLFPFGDNAMSSTHCIFSYLFNFHTCNESSF
jgi:hypothetical protein